MNDKGHYHSIKSTAREKNCGSRSLALIAANPAPGRECSTLPRRGLVDRGAVRLERWSQPLQFIGERLRLHLCISMFHQLTCSLTRPLGRLERSSPLEPSLGKCRKDGLKLGGNGFPAILAAENATGVGMDFVCPPVLVVGLRI